MKTKRKRIFTCVIISTLILGVIVGLNFSKTVIAAIGSDASHAEYGEQLKDQTPESLADATWGWNTGDKSNWAWVDSDTDYFGNVGNQILVAKNADGTAYDSVSFDVQPRKIRPSIKQGTAGGTLANFVPATTKANISTYKKTVTVTAGTGGTVSGSGTYAIGETVSISAMPDEGYEFTGWNDGDNSNPRTIAVNDDIVYTAIFEKGSVKVTSSLPANVGDISIMTLKEALYALEGSGELNPYVSQGLKYSSYGNDYYGSIYDPRNGYAISKYYVYGIKGANGVNSTIKNLNSVAEYLREGTYIPQSSLETFSIAGLEVFGGPLGSFTRTNMGNTTNVKNTITFKYWCGQTSTASSIGSQAYNGDFLETQDCYIAMLCTSEENKVQVSSSLPTVIGDTSIMTVKELYEVLSENEQVNEETYQKDIIHYPPSRGFYTATYNIYATKDKSLSIAEDPESIIDYYTYAWHLPVSPSNIDSVPGIFGGPLEYIKGNIYKPSGTSQDFIRYYNICYYTQSNKTYLFSSNWSGNILKDDAEKCYVAVVRAQR